MKIYITGGSGFIGQYLVKHLVDDGHKPVCLVRPTSNTEALEKVGVELITGDITNKASIKGMNGCDCLVHLASSYEFWVRDPGVYRDVNVKGVTNVMEKALDAGVAKVVMVSTMAVYGNALWPITEESQPGDNRPSKYAQTKYEGELLAWGMFREKGLPLIVIYPSAVLGANDPKAAGRYVKNFACGLMPAQILVDTPFPFVHVQDVSKAILAAIKKEGNIGEKYIVSAENLTFGEFNALICDSAESRLPFLKLPNWLTVLSAKLLTALSRVIKKPPVLDLAIDQIQVMNLGFVLDASKVERDLGLHYSPVRKGVEDAVESLGLSR